MKLSAVANAVLLLSLVSGAQTPEQGAQCISRARGVVFPSFDAYRVAAKPISRHRSAVLSTSYDHSFRTRISNAAKKRPNFAGHYVIDWWGCGAGCSQFAIVDRESGNVYDPPFTNVADHYPQTDDSLNWICFGDISPYKLTSRLLVVEGCLDEDKTCGRHFYVMDKGGLREIQYDPDLPVNEKRSAP